MQRFAPVVVAWDHGGKTREIASMIERAVDERAATVKFSGMDWSAACGSFLTAVQNDTMSHSEQDWLTLAIQGAHMKHRGDLKVWDRLTATQDIAPLCASTAAHRAIETYVPEEDDEEFYVY
jgi:hypothetical protein